MMVYDDKKKVYGHPGDFIIGQITGTTARICAEVDRYWAVESVARLAQPWHLVPKSDVGLKEMESRPFFVFYCPHVTPIHEPLPQASSHPRRSHDEG